MIYISEDATCLKGNICKHLKWVKQPNDDESVEYYHCKAYPKGIPHEILTGEVNHTEEYIDDNGITFEEK
ncbi:MAG: hypothetical protein ACQEQF_00470 [Bacillota bacterium]